MEVKNLKPEKIQVYDCLTFDQQSPDYRSNLVTYNHIPLFQKPLGNIDKNICPNTCYSSSLNSYEITNFQIQSSVSPKSYQYDDNSKEITFEDNISTLLKVSEERKIERFKKKEKLLFRKFQLEEKARFRVIAESKCQRFLKYDCKIGEGGYKLVYKGFDRKNCCDVAWCEIKRDHEDNKEKQQSMFKEIEIMLKLDHPNVVKCFNVLKSWWIIHDDMDGTRTEAKGLVIVQELMNEGTLKGMIKKNFHDGLCILDILLITKWWYQILDVLRYMHCRIQPPIIHRDLKSENCFLVVQPNDDCVSVKIGDFGLATTINHNSKRNTMIGTVGFMAPEVYEEKYDTKVDIYAFGILMLEVMTNKTPYDDCRNVFQVVSKSMGRYLPDVISNLKQPLIEEIIMSCVHPIPCYRPTAEELCEHPLFQIAPVIVEPFSDDANKFIAVMKLMDNLSKDEVLPILDLKIILKTEFINDKSKDSQFEAVIKSFDIYKSYKANLSTLDLALKTFLEKEIQSSIKKNNQLDKLLTSIRLQIQYIIKTVIGERWRRIFDNFLNKEDRSLITVNNFENMPAEEKNVNENDNSENPKLTNNLEEYNFNVSMYHKTTKVLNSEIESYCQESQIKYFSDIFKLINSIKTNNEEADSINKISIEPWNVKTDYKYQNQSPRSPVCLKTKIEDIEVSSTKRNRNTSENISKTTPDSDFKINLTNTSNEQINSIKTIDDKVNEEINPLSSRSTKSSESLRYQLLTSEIESVPSSTQCQPTSNSISNAQNFMSASKYDAIHFRHFSEPAFTYASNHNYPMTSIHPPVPNFNSGTIPSHSKIQSYQNSCHSNISNLNSNYDLNNSVGYLGNFNSQTVLGPNNNLYYQSQHHNQQYIKYILQNQSNLIFSHRNSSLGHNISSIYGGLLYPQAAFINNHLNSNFMHNNIQYNNPVDHTTRQPTGEPVLTRSLPSIIGNQSALENTMASTLIQNTITPGLPSRTPLINNATGINEIPVPQRQILVPSSSTQKLNPTLMSTPRPVINRSQAAISPIPTSKQPQTLWKTTHTLNNTATGSQLTYPPINDNISVPLVVVKTRSESTSSILVSNTSNNNNKVTRGRSFSQVQEKSKPKKPKTRLKSKYLLRIIEIFENPTSKEITLTFEMMLPMHQMRFTCSLNSDINLSKCLGDPGQIPGELRKKEILESLVSTVKKICDCLSEDMNSIPLNEDFVFHPFFPNSGLVKFSDCTYQMQISSEVYESAQSGSGLLNQFNYLNTNPSHFLGNPLTVSSASSRSLSRHASTEDLSWNLSNPMISDQSWLPVSEMEIINPVPFECSKTISNPVTDIQKKSKSVTEIETNRYVKVTSKCGCNPPSKDCCVKIPEYLFPSVKQIMEKLQNPHTKGLIVLPQPSEICVRTLRILEVPAGHMFFGLPCPDSSFNVVKGNKDNDFIIAKDTRQSESIGQTKKCVYQIPSDGAVLLDSTGEIQYLQQPSLVIPSHTPQSKTQIKELPSELTHNKNQSLDCNQIVSVLQSLSMMQNASDFTRDETFDSPVMLESVANQHSAVGDKFDLFDPNQQRRGSGDNNAPGSSSVAQSQSQVQVECVSYQFVPLTKSASSKLEFESGPEFIDRDLPRQQVRNRKISNESLDAISLPRGRGPGVYLNEIDYLSSQQQQQIQQQPVIPKMVVNNPIAIQNVQRTVPVGAILNQVPVQRLPNPNPVGHSGQFVLSSQTTVNQMPSNILMHNLPQGIAQYGNPTSGSTPVTVVMSQSSNTVPVVLTNQNQIGLNYTPIAPNQMVLSSGMMANQMHIPQQQQQQQSQLTNQQRIATPSTMSFSSQHLSNLQGLPMQNLINVTQSMMSGSILPGYTTSMHNSIPTATSEAHFVPVSHPTEFIGLKDQVRQMPPVNIRQIPVGNPPFYDPGYNSPLISDHNLRIRMNQPSSSQSQSQPTHMLYYPIQNLATTTVQNPIPAVNTSKLGLSDQQQLQQQQQQQQSYDSIAINNQISESESKSKTEQTIGRFVIRSVTENTEKT